ncbi:MAG: tRNA (adenosine(37)-N6)-threonylcarbamoyltransferase complex dimerization subunit type 1 TsaB [Christensenellaceae bacterium]|jgi:tRNA threonylcarbamoyladenosine biosynthesis protein TsaB
MIILGIDITGNRLSVALTDQNSLLGEININAGKKHSITLLQAVDDLLRLTGKEAGQVDVFACANGPGSFTGIRIGVNTVSAMAYAAGKPIADVNALLALTKNVQCSGFPICAMMDARRREVYALAVLEEQIIVEEAACPLDELLAELPERPVVFVGDGALAYRQEIEKIKTNAVFLKEKDMLQKASSICVLAHEKALQNRLIDYKELAPHYLRESQAERMRRENIGRTRC